MGEAREQPTLRRLQKRSEFATIMVTVEKVNGERWEEFRDRYGDGRKDLGLRLGELQQRDQGCAAVGTAQRQSHRVIEKTGTHQSQSDQCAELTPMPGNPL